SSLLHLHLSISVPPSYPNPPLVRRRTYTLAMHFSEVSVATALLALLPATIATPHYYSLFSRDSNTGLCGAANGGLKCDGSAQNTCCSPTGYCGDTADHCGTGCQSAYGVCFL